MQKKIILIAFAFSVLLVIPLNVFADSNTLTISKSATATQNFVDEYIQHNIDGKWYVWAIGGTLTSEILNKYNMTSGALIASYDLDVLAGTTTMTANGIWCSSAYCYVAWQDGSGDSSGIISRHNGTGYSGGYNFPAPASYNMFRVITGRDVSGDGSIVNIFASMRDDAGFGNTDSVIQLGDEGSGFTQTRIFTDTALTIGDIVWSGVGGVTNNYLLVGATNSKLHVYNLSSAGLGTLCTYNTAGGGIILPNYTTVSAKAYIANGTTFEAFNTCTPDPLSDITSAYTGLTGNIRDGIILPDRNIMVIQEQGANGFISVLPFDETTNVFSNRTATYETFPVSSQTALHFKFGYATDINKIAIALSGSDKKILFGTFGGTSGPVSGGSGCELPENADLLRCVLASSEGTPLKRFSDLTGESFGTSTNSLFIQLGLVAEGSDIKTNGVGYAIVGIGLGIMIAIFLLASGGDLKQIPTFVWFIGTLGFTGAFTAFGVVDATFFIVTILVIIALASAKIVSTLDLGRF